MFDTTFQFRRWWRIAGALGAGLLGACSGPEAPGAAAGAGKAAAAQPTNYIKVEAVGTDAHGLHGTLPGRLAFRTDAMAAVGSPFTGRVLSIEVRPGQAVKAGAPLVVLQSADTADVRAAYQQAQARLALAQDALRRQNDMMARGIGIEVERYSAEVALREATSENDRARQSAAMAGKGTGERLVLRSPSVGVVLAIRTQPGAVVAPGGDALVDIGDPKRLWVVADAPERELAGIAPGGAAQVRIPGVDATLEASIDSIGNAIDPEQRRMPVYLTFKDNQANTMLSAGMYAQVRVQDSQQRPLSVATAAVLIKNGAQRQVFLQREDGNYEPRIVRTGISRAGRVEILEGLTAGDKVVVQGALLLDNEAQQLL